MKAEDILRALDARESEIKRKGIDVEKKNFALHRVND